MVRARELWLIPALLVVAAFLYLLQFAVSGAAMRDVMADGCTPHQPPGWYERTQVVATWSGTPPRFACHFSHPVTGETAYWDSGHAATVPWLLMWSALLGVAVVVGRFLRHAQFVNTRPPAPLRR